MGLLFNARSIIDDDTDAPSKLQLETNIPPPSAVPLSRWRAPKKHVTFQIDPSTIDSEASRSDEEHFLDMESSTNVYTNMSSVKTSVEEDKSPQASALTDGDGEYPRLLDRMI